MEVVSVAQAEMPSMLTLGVYERDAIARQKTIKHLGRYTTDFHQLTMRLT